MFPRGFVRKLVEACQEHTVWHATSFVDSEEPIPEIADLVNRTFTWGWGYEPEMFTGPSRKEREWLIDSRGHSYTWVPPELRDRPFRAVKLGGGADLECLQDMREVLAHVGIDYVDQPELIF